MNVSVENLRTIFEQATVQEIKAGCAWYAHAKHFCQQLAGEYQVPTRTVAAVVAALSPANRWGRNKTNAQDVIRTWAAGGTPADVSVSSFNACKEQAFAILDSGDPGLLTGQKRIAFAANIAGDLSLPTIDRHAYNAAVGARVIIDAGGPRITEKRYRDAAAAYVELADETGFEPAQVQAIVWLVWRRLEVPGRFMDD